MKSLQEILKNGITEIDLGDYDDYPKTKTPLPSDIQNKKATIELGLLIADLENNKRAKAMWKTKGQKLGQEYGRNVVNSFVPTVNWENPPQNIKQQLAHIPKNKQSPAVQSVLNGTFKYSADHPHASSPVASATPKPMGTP